MVLSESSTTTAATTTTTSLQKYRDDLEKNIKCFKPFSLLENDKTLFRNFRVEEVDCIYSLLEKEYDDKINYYLSLYCRLKDDVYVYILRLNETKYYSWYTHDPIKFLTEIRNDDDIKKGNKINVNIQQRRTGKNVLLNTLYT